MQCLPRPGSPLEARPLTFGVPLHPVCQEEPYNPGRDVSINPNKNSILTLSRTIPDVRLVPIRKPLFFWGLGKFVERSIEASGVAFGVHTKGA